MSSLTVYQRNKWKPIPRRGKVTRRSYSSIHDFVIHWPGGSPRSWRGVDTMEEEIATWRSFQRTHILNNGWSDIGYNLGMGNGGFGKRVPRVWTLRGVQYVPASQLGANSGTMSLVLLVGPDDPITESIIRRVRSTIRWAERLTGNNLRVRPHNFYTYTECPGPRLRKLIASGAFNA